VWQPGHGGDLAAQLLLKVEDMWRKVKETTKPSIKAVPFKSI